MTLRHHHAEAHEAFAPDLARADIPFGDLCCRHVERRPADSTPRQAASLLEAWLRDGLRRRPPAYTPTATVVKTSVKDNL